MKKKAGLTLILVAVLIFFAALLSEDGRKKSKPKITEKYSTRVNEHLTMTQVQMDIESEKLKYELEQERSKAGILKLKDKDSYRPELDPYAELAVSEETIEEAGRNTLYEPFPDPQQMIQKELFENEQQREYDKSFKDAYARKFIENAKRGGWDVTLDKDYKVKSVKPIKSSNNRFPVLQDRPPTGAN